MPVNALETAATIVQTRMGELNAISGQFNSQLMGALQTLGQIQMGHVAEPGKVDLPKPANAPVKLNNAPTLSLANLNIGTVPQPPNVDGLISALDIPDFTVPAAPSLPALHIPNAPGLANIAAPTEPVVDTTISYPTAPSLALPSMDALHAITIPAFTFPTLPDFTDQPPGVGNLTAPSVTLQWSEPQYASEVLDDLIAKVREWMQGGTGLPAHVENALFWRARERDAAETTRAVQQAVDMWAARGFDMPPGMLVAQTDAIQNQGRIKAAELNRDILIQAAQWEIENLRHAVTQGMALEQLTQNLFENTTRRAFEIARLDADMRMQLFNAQISLFNAQNAAFQTLAQVYKTRLEGALAKLQAYRAAIDAQQAIGQLNSQKVEIYKARLSAVQTSADLFSALMKGAEVKASVIAKQFDLYRTRVQAYGESIGAEKLKFDAYAAQIDGEKAKANIFEAQARAYASTIQAIANRADIKAKSAALKMDAAKIKLAAYEGQLGAFKAQTDAGLANIRQHTEAFRAKVAAWQAQTQTIISADEVQKRFADMNVRGLIAKAEMHIGRYQASIGKTAQQTQISLEAAKAMGQYSAQLAAGAMSAMNVSAGISGSGSQSGTNNLSTNHNYSY